MSAEPPCNLCNHAGALSMVSRAYPRVQSPEICTDCQCLSASGSPSVGDCTFMAAFPAALPSARWVAVTWQLMTPTDLSGPSAVPSPRWRPGHSDTRAASPRALLVLGGLAAEKQVAQAGPSPEARRRVLGLWPRHHPQCSRELCGTCPSGGSAAAMGRR